MRCVDRETRLGFVPFAIEPLLVIGLVAGGVFLPDRSLAQIDPHAKYETISILSGYDTRLPHFPAGDNAARLEANKKRNEAAGKRREAGRLVLDILRGNTPLAGNGRTMFDLWFNKIIFAEMTQTDQQSLEELPKNRERFFRENLQRKDIDPSVHAELVRMTGTQMLQIARGNFHPAVRYNAVIILGQLNSREAVLTGNPKPPVPMPQALVALLGEYKNPDQIDAVRVAALVGILRHADLDGQHPDDQRMPLRQRYDIQDEMLSLIQMKDPPAGRSLSGHRWMQRRAIEILGGLRDVGAGNRVSTELDRLISDESLPLNYRCTAAVAYGQLKFQPKDVDPSKAAHKIAFLALTGCRDRLQKLLEEAQPADAAGPPLAGRPAAPLAMPALPPRPVLGFGGEEPANELQVDDRTLTNFRRVLKFYTQCAQWGAIGRDDKSGFKRYAAQEPHTTFIKDLNDALGKLMKSTDKSKEDRDLELTADLIVPRVELALRELEKVMVVAGPKDAGNVVDPLLSSPADAASPLTGDPALKGLPGPLGGLPDLTQP